jgi:dihydroorotate dehydrogenase electron transfer subunit
MSRHEKAMLLSTKLVAADTYEMVIETKNAKTEAVPGQFVHIQVPNRPDLLLRRPISINSVDTKTSTITLIIQAKKEGTRILCNLAPNTILDMIGPVGRGFFLRKEAARVALVGGGIGVAPLRYLIERYPKVEFHSFLGYRNKKYVYQAQIFNKLSSMHMHTDDGSMGTKGFATDTLDVMLNNHKFDAVYACGPTPMFAALKKVMEKHPEVECYISLEERMGCGIGGCKVCVCKTNDDGIEDYKKVCQDGPVFDIRKVVL